MGERFPNIEWYCDKCNAYLNNQAGFDDNYDEWRCTKCGHKNTISEDEIDYDGLDYMN